jgi:hypothetical protein
VTSGITDSDVSALVARMDEAADAYIRGDLSRYLELFDHGDDYTLMPPYGGETWRGFEYDEKSAEETRRFFRSGEALADRAPARGSPGAGGPLRALRAARPRTRRVAGEPER